MVNNTTLIGTSRSAQAATIAALFLWLVPSTVGAQTVCDGTPDAFDYLCTPLGATLEPANTPTGIVGDDVVSPAIPIGFSFNYYDVDYTSVFVSSNGFLSFLDGQGSGCCSGQIMPNTSGPNGIIAGIWTDLHTRNGTINTGLVGEAPNRRFVVSWQDVEFLSNSPETLTFQIVLHENGDIDIVFGQLSASTRVISTGMENESGTIGIQVYNGSGTPPEEQGFRLSRVDFRADAGGTYNIPEGTPEVALSAARSRGEIVSYAWDLDLDGEYDDAVGSNAVLDTSALDGPGELRVGLQVVDVNDEVSTAEATISAFNVAPVLTSIPDPLANIGSEYVYNITVDDPGADLDPLTYTVIEGPEGTAISDEGALTWTPGVQDLDLSFNFRIEINDGDEGVVQQAWTVLAEAPDADNDDIPDDFDNCIQTPNPEQLDADQDGFGDTCDPDDDNDNVIDGMDNCVFVANPDQANNDPDPDGDACDDDDDNDFIPDEDDNCPTVTNPDQTDEDNDGVGDACSNDADLDGLPDDIDNCPALANIDQLDLDSDGIGDVCDDDRDGDGLSNDNEADLGTDPDDIDTDGDSLDDREESEDLMTNPLLTDTDEDNIDDDEEIALGTDPLLADSDEDGLNDGRELDEGTDPLLADSDDDGLSDGEELNTTLTDPNEPDSDGGSISDGQEVDAGTDPNNPDDDVPDDGDNNGFNNTPNQPDTEPEDPPTDTGGGGDCTVAQGPAHTPLAALFVALMLGLARLRRR